MNIGVVDTLSSKGGNFCRTLTRTSTSTSNFTSSNIFQSKRSEYVKSEHKEDNPTRGAHEYPGNFEMISDVEFSLMKRRRKWNVSLQRSMCCLISSCEASFSISAFFFISRTVVSSHTTNRI